LCAALINSRFQVVKNKAVMIKPFIQMRDRLLEFIGRIIFPRPLPKEGRHEVKMTVIAPHSEGPAQTVSSVKLTALKTKAGPLFLALALGLSTVVVVTGITGCVNGPFTSNLNQSPPYDKPTWRGDDHAQPVYTSPTVTPATNNLANSPS
jgi:hypothetical protein